MFESRDFREVWAPRLLSIVRILLGLLYMQHGLSKYFGFPAAPPQNFEVFSLIGLVGAMETVGGLMVALGIYTRWAAFIRVRGNGGRLFHRQTSLVRQFLPSGQQRPARGRLQPLLLHVLPGRRRRMEPRPAAQDTVVPRSRRSAES